MKGGRNERPPGHRSFSSGIRFPVDRDASRIERRRGVLANFFFRERRSGASLAVILLSSSTNCNCTYASHGQPYKNHEDMTYGEPSPAFPSTLPGPFSQPAQSFSHPL